MKLKFGKYAGWDLEQVPDDYVDFMIKSQTMWVEERERRDLIRESESSWVEKVIKAGQRDLAKRYHPDHGGTTQDMQAVNAAVAQLMELLEQLKEPT